MDVEERKWLPGHTLHSFLGLFNQTNAAGQSTLISRNMTFLCDLLLDEIEIVE